MEGSTPLHLAVLHADPDMVALLLKYNASRYEKDQDGRSPIDYAFDSSSAAADEIIEQFSVEDTVIETKQPSLLEQSVSETKLPVITSADLEVHELISKGSSCQVYRGVWRDSEVAVKQFKTEYSSSPKEMQKFIKEMQILNQVRHPNLLLLMGIVLDQPSLCLVTEYVPYCSLFQALHKKPKKKLTLSDRFKVSIQIAKGLAYLHSNSPPIVHRDLKPENCLMDSSGNIKIADFGLARPVTAFASKDCQQSTTVCIGTTRFMAPELFDNDLVETIGTEVDIWALGCLLIEVFSNKRPWHYISSSNSNCIFYEIFYRKPVPIPENVPSDVKEIIQQCCRYDPARRPPIRQVLKELEAAKQHHRRLY